MFGSGRLSRKSFLAGGAIAFGALASACNLMKPESASPTPAPVAPDSGQAPAAAASTQQSGGGKLDQVLARGKVIVGTDSATPPFCFKDADGNWTGFDIEFARQLANGLFQNTDAVEFVDEQPSSRIPNLQADKVDFVIQAMTITAQRAQLVNFTAPYYRDAVNIVLPKNSQYDNYTQLSGAQHKIAILQNRDAEDGVHQYMPDSQVLQFDTQAAAVLAVESGRADAAMVEHPMAMYMAAQNPDKFKAGSQAYGPNNFGIAVRAGDWQWLYWLNTAIDDLITGQQYAQFAPIYKRWFGEDPPAPKPGSPLAA
ncbi:MAG: transporter substrate-binding domain-containing protein [Chloroflexi bacterium]|nr:transporter substrate-binding domain-containing protein [Chloroflexota bacterium]